jgi:hypothetical protein
VTEFQWPEFKPTIRLDPYGPGPGFPAIVDADALLASIDNQCRKGWQSRLSQLCGSDVVPVFASEHVYWEVYRRLSRFASATTTLAELRNCFEEHYLPGIVWVRVADGYGDDERTTRITDANDVTTGHLATLIAPCMIYAEDKSLRRPGFAPREWRQAAGSAVTVVDSETGKRTVVVAVGAPVIGVAKGCAAIGRRLGAPGWTTATVVIILTAWLLWSDSRRRAIGKFLTPILTQFAANEAAQQQALSDLVPVMFQPTTPPTTKQMVATVLARASEPLLAADVHEEIRDHFRLMTAPTLAEVRKVLASEREFTKQARSRWGLGRAAAPLTDSAFVALLEEDT